MKTYEIYGTVAAGLETPDELNAAGGKRVEIYLGRARGESYGDAIRSARHTTGIVPRRCVKIRAVAVAAAAMQEGGQYV